MAKIKILDDLTIQKIAAGEVIERPASIVKELVENSIDANSNSITIEIKNGGKSYIRITDDGDGIQKDDLSIAFKKHSTSKIEKIEDIFRIMSLGFRGEALSSIASVAKVEALTKTYSSEVGLQAFVEDGEITNMFAYFFDINREAFSHFAREVLHIDVQTDFSIEREKRNIDLLISDKNNAIVIENKIKSSINGIDDRHDIYSDQVQSQLKKYYQFVTSDDEYRKKTASCFIFSPNYNRIDLSKFSCGEKYTIVYYREVYNFFVENRNLYEVPYFDDFINAMYKHTKDYDNDLEEEMQRRFQNTIFKAKNVKNRVK